MKNCQCFNSGAGYSCFTGNCSACGLPITNNLRQIGSEEGRQQVQPTFYTEEDLRKAWENGYSYSVHRNETIMREKYKKFLEKLKNNQ